MSTFSIPTIASLKSAVDELRVQYYPKNETERRVSQKKEKEKLQTKNLNFLSFFPSFRSMKPYHLKIGVHQQLY